MNEIEKFRRLFEFQEAFPEASGDIDALKAGLTLTPDVLARMERGFQSEDWFASVHSSLPWIRLVHPLGQRQRPPESKAELQVPDYLVIVRAEVPGSGAKYQDSAFLVEAKSVAENKQTFSISAQLLEQLETYAKVIQLPLLISVFWRDIQMWTTHSPDQLSAKRKGRGISLDSALRSDMSFLFSDVLLFVKAGWKRTTTYDPKAVGYHVHDPARGFIIKDVVDVGSGAPVELDEVQSGILEVLFRGRILTEQRTGDFTVVSRESQIDAASKATSIVNFLLARFDWLKEDDKSRIAFDIASHFIVLLGLTHTANLPKALTPGVTAAAERVFGVHLSDE
ncbi:MAG: hypothetical protein ACYC7A_06705 [Thermoanaerobaculia bacterium]